MQVSGIGWVRDLGNPQIGVPLPVVQHECDHLDGVLFPDRLSDPTAFGFIPELEAAGLIPAVTG